ncbi:MAG: NTP transferase domain-containing protein [Candidatus Heimdallarchaeota archaeon]|nr:NTP transferase domain-containing protein [Candidatus Heimdallarchaeota archaeon]
MASKYPVFVLCGSDKKKRELLKYIDPDEKYGVKGLVPFLGKPMMDWQIEELIKSPYVEELYLLGVTEKQIKFDFHVNYVPISATSNYGEKLVAGLNYLRAQGKNFEKIVVSSSDTPGITVDAIDEFFEAVEKYEDYEYIQVVVSEESVKAIFPEHERVVGNFTDINVFPGELFAVNEKAIKTCSRLIDEFGRRRRLIKRRERSKKTSALTPIIRMVLKRPKTWPYVIKFIRGKLDLKGAEKVISIISKLKAKAIISHDGASGMDIDLPEDYDKLKQYVSKAKNIPYTEGIS